MGSYGDIWLHCDWCWRWGKCVADEFLDGADPLTDVDGVGLLCDRCLDLDPFPFDLGPYGNRDLQCGWCWRWGKCVPAAFLNGADPLTNVLGVGLKCNRCLDLEEPPWWPNNRQRCATTLHNMRLLPALLRNSLDEEFSVLMAAYLVKNLP